MSSSRTSAPSTTTRIAIALLALGACGGKKKSRDDGDPNVTATAHVEGGNVVVDVACRGTYDITYQLGDPRTTCTPDKPGRLAIAASQLGTGKQTVTLDATKRRTGPTT